MTDILTSAEAAALLGVDRTTTQRAARTGQVPEARQEPRPRTINAPWVATREAWETWYQNRRPAGRPRKGGMTVNVRRVHCTTCHPDGGDIEREGFTEYRLVRVDEGPNGEEHYPICPTCGREMDGRKLWRNGHNADGLEPA